MKFRPEDPFTPYRVCLERFDGLERNVVAYPAAKDAGEAIALAEAQCHAERTAYREAARKVATDILKELGAYEAHTFLLELKAAEKRAQEAARYVPPVLQSLGRTPVGPLPNWADGGKRASAPPLATDVAIVLPSPPKKQERRVFIRVPPAAIIK